MNKGIQLKRVYDPQERGDGRRFLIDRIWPRGISKEKLGKALWLKEIAPSAELRKWFGHDPDRWNEFRKRYLAELREKNEPVQTVLSAIRKGPVTLLYAAKDKIHNHALVLRDHLEKKP